MNRTNEMSEPWNTQKAYIDSAAKEESLKVGVFVLTVTLVASCFYGVNIAVTAFGISSLEKRATAAEAKVAACEKAIEMLTMQEDMAK